MNPQAVAGFIIAQWQRGHGPGDIAQALRFLGVSFDHQKVAKVIRRYVDLTTENRALHRAR